MPLVPPAFGPRPTKPLVTTAAGNRAPEWVEVVYWRYEELRRAGWPADLAMEVAAEMGIDLHRACELVGAGCSPERALSILG